MRRSSCSTSSGSCRGRTSTSRGPPRSTRNAATTLAVGPAPAYGCSRSGSGAARAELWSQKRRNQRLPRPAAQLDLPAGEADVDLAADTEAAGEVDSRLDREAGVGQVTAHVAGFEIVVVHSVAVAVVIDAVPGAVQEPLAVSGLHDHRA